MLSHFGSVLLCDSMDCSLPGSSVHGIVQAKMLEWVAMPSSRASSWPRDQICISYWQADSLPLAPFEKPSFVYMLINLFQIVHPIDVPYWTYQL